jgi:hypothetical protein
MPREEPSMLAHSMADVGPETDRLEAVNIDPRSISSAISGFNVPMPVIAKNIVPQFFDLTFHLCQQSQQVYILNTVI